LDLTLFLGAIRESVPENRLFVLKRRIDPASLTDDELVERWKGWLDHTKHEAYQFYAFRFKLVGSVFISRYPEPQYNWLQPFTIPWAPNDFKPWEKPDEPDEIK
jgi:hypothetical protein